MRIAKLISYPVFLLGLVSFAAFAVSPDQLQRRLAAGDQVTLIDVRPTALFQTAHIPNAINVPAKLVPQKQLPPLGKAIVYDAGTGPDTAREAALALGRKGISAEVLEGGFAAWEQATRSTTRAPGMKPEQLPMISYADLKQVPVADLVLVDLRQRQPAALDKAAAQTPAQPLTDLGTEFPGARITSSPFQGPVKTASGSPLLLVLIDNGNDTAAERMARTLKANGTQRFAILVGGEMSLARKGEPGLQRLGTTISPRRRQVTPPTP